MHSQNQQTKIQIQYQLNLDDIQNGKMLADHKFIVSTQVSW
jgi:hypothetical protein